MIFLNVATQERRKNFFFEKKKQKTFGSVGMQVGRVGWISDGGDVR